ncbi:hypothetical protein BKA93DRAFT_746283 [Sparassis latifolia]
MQGRYGKNLTGLAEERTAKNIVANMVASSRSGSLQSQDQVYVLLLSAGYNLSPPSDTSRCDYERETGHGKEHKQEAPEIRGNPTTVVSSTLELTKKFEQSCGLDPEVSNAHPEPKRHLQYCNLKKQRFCGWELRTRTMPFRSFANAAISHECASHPFQVPSHVPSSLDQHPTGPSSAYSLAYRSRYSS